MCYISEIDNIIAGYCWIARNRFYIDEIDHAIILEPQDLYLHNAYVLKKYRRYNVTTSNIFAARRDLIPHGYSREIVAIMDWNIPSRKFVLKLGFEEIGSITVGYIMTFRYTIKKCTDLNFSSQVVILDFYRRLFRKIKNLVN